MAISAESIRSQVIVDPPDNLDTDIAIIGSGMGGGTLAYALRDCGARVLLIEKGDFLPVERENWSLESVHLNRRYKNSAPWHDPGTGKDFLPGNYHYVGGNTKLYGATLPRFREYDFQALEHIDGTSPAWPISYAELEPYKGADGSTTTLSNTIFSTVPGAPVFVAKAAQYRSRHPGLGHDLNLTGHNALQSTFVFDG